MSQYTISAKSLDAITKAFTDHVVGLAQATERAIDIEVRKRQQSGVEVTEKGIATIEQQAVNTLLTNMQAASREGQLALQRYSQKKLEQDTARAKRAQCR